MVTRLLALLPLLAGAQPFAPLPYRPPGFAFNPATNQTAVVIRGFFDLLCPDSKAAWPVVQQVRGAAAPRPATGREPLRR